ncbi:hypothetical protein V5799_003279 [Amblyomma americanum]|uniref:Uncharacterized protein n=1 Tax=Amblyomma americanum TaxID=6943 RepID=A0AAQ4D9E7_AMBAM
MRTSLTLAQKKKDIERAGRPMASKKERGSPSDTSEASLAENRLVSPSATDSPAGEVDDHQDSSKAPVDAADLNLREKAVNTTVREGPGSTAAKDPVLSVEDTEGQTASDGESSEESLQQDSPTDGQGKCGSICDSGIASFGLRAYKIGSTISKKRCSNGTRNITLQGDVNLRTYEPPNV